MTTAAFRPPFVIAPSRLGHLLRSLRSLAARSSPGGAIANGQASWPAHLYCHSFSGTRASRSPSTPGGGMRKAGRWPAVCR